MKMFAFELTMPNVGSWNGRWSGEKDLHVRFRKLTKSQLENSEFKTGHYFYNFGDGWSVNVIVTETNSQERRRLERRSKGFAGYDWMIDSIIKHGEIRSE